MSRKPEMVRLPPNLRAIDPSDPPSADDPFRGYGEGDVIGQKYRLGRLLGEGGMGEVWLAHNQTLDIDVAVKLIRADVETTDNADRLLQEARAAARLGHPAIVRIFDFGTTDRGEPFIAMELLQGEDLHSSLGTRGRLSPAKAIRMLLPIAHALKEAHGKGIVHRDLKPENIFLQETDDGSIQPKLVDFGVAKLERKAGRLTETGALLGSPLYMSPEQARGDDVDHRADIWALCVVLYEAITGRTPFEGKNYNAVLYAIIANEPPASTLLGAGDDALWHIIRRGLEKDPDRRWQSMRDLGAALSRWLMERGVNEDITGASIDTCWLQRTSLQEMDTDLLEERPLAPIGGTPPQGGRGRFATTRNVRRDAWSWTGWGPRVLMMLLLGVLLVLAWKSRPVPVRPAESFPVETPKRTPEANAGVSGPVLQERVARDRQRAVEPPIPVEALEMAPPEPERSKVLEPSASVRAPTPRLPANTVRAPVEVPPRSVLKDPFQ